METVKEFLKSINEKEGWDTDDTALSETLVEYGRKVHDGAHDWHRWYIREIGAVQQIEGKFIQYDDYIVTGDNNMDDMDLEYDLDAAKFVNKKERQVIEVYYEQ